MSVVRLTLRRAATRGVWAGRCLSNSSASADAGENFGYQKVGVGEKEGKVRGVFESVASNYDVMNDLMSAGMHRVWKDCFVAAIGVPAIVRARQVRAAAGRPEEPLRFLDVAGGTGDIAFRIISQLDKAGGLHAASETPASAASTASTASTNKPAAAPGAAASGGGGGGGSSSGSGHLLAVPRATVTISDINPAMLGVGQTRAGERFSPAALEAVGFQEANAQALPFADNTFDVYTIAFGLRNVTDIGVALAEARRVLKPGGRFLCLEFSHVPPAWGPLGPLYDAYSFAAIPLMGQLVANDRASYQYLVESIRLFPKQEELVAKMEAAGLSHASYTNYTAGVVAVHSGFKL